MPQYYYVQKQGVNPQGVFAISEDLEELKRFADKLASDDGDAYHSWHVLRHTRPTVTAPDISHWNHVSIHCQDEVVYAGVRTRNEND